MPRTLRERLADRWGDQPLLRLLVCTPKFALVLLLLALALFGPMVALPRVVTASPPGVQPVVKVSVADLLRVWSNKTAAKRHAAAGRGEEALRCWRQAASRNPADLAIWRSVFRLLTEAPELVPLMGIGSLERGGAWLLQLGRTNVADLELVATAYGHWDAPAPTYRLLEPVRDHLSPRLEIAYLKALFRLGRYREFCERYPHAREYADADPTFELYRSAYLVCWGTAAETEEAVHKLRRRAEDSSQGTLARRLAMDMAFQCSNCDAARAAFERLQAFSEDAAADHAHWWLLLQRHGHLDEAVRLARAYNRVPASAADVVAVGESLLRLGLASDCVAFLDRYASEFGRRNDPDSLEVWSLLGRARIRLADWDGLGLVATRLRACPELRESVTGYIAYLDGRVTQGRGAATAARAAFEEAVALGFPVGCVGVAVGRDLLELGMPDLAMRALEPLQSLLPDSEEYWHLLHRCALERRVDDDLLLLAARRAHELNPTNRLYCLDYATALVVNRQLPETALDLVRGADEPLRSSSRVRLVEALALAQTGRMAEAMATLDQMSAATLSPDERQMYHQAALEVHRSRQDWARVRSSLGVLRQGVLYPGQAQWLDTIERSIRRGQGASGG